MKIRKSLPILFLLLVFLPWSVMAAGDPRQSEEKEGREQIAQAIRFLRAGAYDEALQQALRALEAVQGNTPLEAATHNILGQIHEAAGRPERAVAEYETALGLFEKTGDVRGLGTVNINLIRAHAAVAELSEDPEQRRRHYEEAQEHYRRTIEFAGSEGSLVAAASRQIAALNESRGDLEQAKEYARRAVEVLERDSKKNPRQQAAYLDEYARLLEADGKLEEAAEIYERSLETKSGAFEPGDAGITDSFRHLGRLACLREDRTAAMSLLERSYAMSSRLQEPTTLERVLVAATLAGLKEEKAAAAYDEKNREMASADGVRLWGWAVAELPGVVPGIRPPLAADAVLEALMIGPGRCARPLDDVDAFLTEYIAERQRRLQVLRFYRGEIDGQVGPRMEEAVLAFREKLGLREGLLDLETDRRLEEQAREAE